MLFSFQIQCHIIINYDYNDYNEALKTVLNDVMEKNLVQLPPTVPNNLDVSEVNPLTMSTSFMIS